MRIAARIGSIVVLSLCACSARTSGADLFGSDASTEGGINYDSDGGAGDSSIPKAPRSAIVIGIRTDMKVPADFDSFHLEVSQNAIAQFTADFAIANNPLPTSLTICASDALCNGVVKGDLPPGKIVALDAAAKVTITLVGMSRGKATTVRVARTSLVANRVLALPLVMEDACRGQVDDKGSVITSSCPSDQSCVGGTCASLDVDPSTLADAP